MTLLQLEWLEGIDFFYCGERPSNYDSLPRILPNLLALEISDVSPRAFVDRPSCSHFEKRDLFFCLQPQWQCPDVLIHKGKNDRLAPLLSMRIRCRLWQCRLNTIAIAYHF